MDRDEVLAEFREAGALLKGHFVLSSGLHSDMYLQCARVMMYPDRGERLCRALAEKVREAFGQEIDMVASPALGGILVGYELARQLALPAIFFERIDGRFVLRRGFAIAPGTRCLVVEDVVTTGLSSRECIAAIEAEGGTVTGAGCLIDRSDGEAELGVRLVSLAELQIPTYTADSVPDSLARLPVDKPGSRTIKA